MSAEAPLAPKRDPERAAYECRFRKDKPNDAVLFDLLADWAPDEALRRRVLVENPQALYGYGGSG